MTRIATLVLGLVVAAASVASAQQPASAAAGTTADSRDSATAVPPPPPPEPSLIDRARQWVQDTKIIERMNGTADGWYPRLGGIRHGSGVGGGPGYRTHVGPGLLVDVSGAISVRNYQTLDAQVRWLRSRDGRAEFWTDYTYDDFPLERFFGIGGDSVESARTAYGRRTNDIAARGRFRPRDRLALTATLGYLHPDIRSTHHEWPSTDARFTDAEAAGLLTQPSFVHAQLAADLDLRNASGRPTAGGIYHAAIGRWNGDGSDAYDFRRVDVTAAQFFPLSPDRRHVLAVRGGLNAATADHGARVPFYFLPFVGGNDTVRSYVEYRFQAEDAMWYGAEYRWTVAPYVSVATFIDSGRVARTWRGFGSAPTRTGYGAGVIGHTDKQTLGRFDLATGSEGWRLWFDVGMF